MGAALRRTSARAAVLLLAACSVATPVRARQGQTPQVATAQPVAPKPAALPQKVTTREGATIEFNVEPGDPAKGLVEGADAVVTLKFTDSASRPVAGARPSAWLSRKGSASATTDASACREKVRSFLQGSLAARAEVDLNSYFVLALNDEPNISVIDPLVSFGASKLLTLVMLKSPGDDWAMSGDGKRVYVSMPAANQIAVVDTATWRVTANVETGARPTL
ncbi:MAG: cytochrome D1, partial [Acidobacteria bacterium]|nr:cytochrome D1 [Acidobacteriota bacterium]